jgi:hypothetical protein
MPFGHDSTIKAPNTLRIALTNAGGFPISAQDEKNKVLRGFVQEKVGQAAEERATRIQEEFDEGCILLAKDAQLLFRPGLNRILRYREGQQKAWLARIEVARQRALVRQEEAKEEAR